MIYTHTPRCVARRDKKFYRIALQESLCSVLGKSAIIDCKHEQILQTIEGFDGL